RHGLRALLQAVAHRRQPGRRRARVLAPRGGDAAHDRRRRAAGAEAAPRALTVRETCLWWEQAPLAVTRSEERPLPPSADVAVIGGGYTGLSAARTLARAGARVVVLEKESIGWGASSRNGGQVVTGLKVGAAELVARYGEARACELFRASLDAI